ncbi:hypothetical protein [Candidatus Nitrosotenuis aquarius]|uniref:hypothetical protein n=1 Tax=Candidatus Nitrosotenuis aquarius TaxID=1846278 RepID=UPI000C1DE072|nr:hypothetical protein [Candidatus Nitrosotenuis aquarius]
MPKSLIVFSVLMSVLLITSYSSNFVFAQSNTKIKNISSDDKKNTSKAKVFADEMRKKVLEKYHNDYKSKKLDSKKQIALEAKKKLDSKKYSK